MSESFLTAGFLSLSGGLQDAYTYMSRGKVFANAQTGNIVLLSQSIGSGDWPLAIHYLVPLLSFALGVAAAELIRQTFHSGIPFRRIPSSSQAIRRRSRSSQGSRSRAQC